MYRIKNTMPPITFPGILPLVRTFESFSKGSITDIAAIPAHMERGRFRSSTTHIIEETPKAKATCHWVLEE